jgi:hypothetical protein
MGRSGRVGVSRPVDGFDSSSSAGLSAFKLAFLLKIPHQTPDFHLLALHKTNKPSTKSPKRALPLVPAHRFMICFVDFMEINCSIVPSASLFQADRLMNCRSCSSKLRTFMPGEGEKLTFHWAVIEWQWIRLWIRRGGGGGQLTLRRWQIDCARLSVSRTLPEVNIPAAEIPSPWYKLRRAATKKPEKRNKNRTKKLNFDSLSARNRSISPRRPKWFIDCAKLYQTLRISLRHGEWRRFFSTSRIPFEDNRSRSCAWMSCASRPRPVFSYLMSFINVQKYHFKWPLYSEKFNLWVDFIM